MTETINQTGNWFWSSKKTCLTENFNLLLKYFSVQTKAVFSVICLIEKTIFWLFIKDNRWVFQTENLKAVYRELKG